MDKRAHRSLTENGAARSDAELAVLARGGDKRAFVEIVARHQGMVAGVALAILRDFAASEDAAQEAFLAAWKKIGDLREPEKLRAWLASIARSTARMHLRKLRPTERIDETLEAADGAIHRPDEQAAGSEEAALVLSALEALPENYRLPLVLFYREEKSVRAVAETLGLSEDAVKQRLARGREMLRERVAGVIDSVLGRTLPTAVFTMTVAAAIGALVAPSALAASVFSAASTAGATAASATGSAAAANASAAPALTTTTTATATATTMSLTKLSLTAAAIVAICVPVGYTARLSREPDKNDGALLSKARISESAAPDPQAPPELPDSPLVLEWKRLLAEHGTSPDGLARLHAALETLDDPFRKRAFLSALVAEWAKTDPRGGMAFFREEGREWWQRELFVAEAVKADPGAALAALKASGKDWEGLARDHLGTFAQRAPAGVPALVAQLPGATSAWDTKVRDAFAIAAQTDLNGMRAAAEALAGPNRVQALAGVAMAWAEKDGEVALAWAQKQAEGEERHEVMRATLLGWARTDPAAALDRVQLVPAGGDDMRFASSTAAQLLRAAAESDFEATIAWLRENPGTIGHRDLIGLSVAVQPRLVADPGGFLSQAQADGSLPHLLPAIGSAVLNDAANSRLEIWEWLRDAPDEDGVAPLRETVLNSLGWKEPRVAMGLVDELPENAERDRLMERTAMSILNGGSNAGVLEYLLDEVTPAWRSQLLLAGFQTLRSDHLHDPGIWIERLDELGAERRRAAVPAMAMAWAQNDPEASAAWVSSLEEPAERSDGTRALAGSWARSDPYAAGAWAAALPPGEERDAAAAGLVREVARTDPEGAWEWVESIGTVEDRLQAAAQVLGPMVQRDRDGALGWLRSSGLPQADKEELEAMVEGGKLDRKPGR